MNERAVADLARSGINQTQAKAAGIFEVEDASTIAPNLRQLPALVLPYYDVHGEPVIYGGGQHFCRVRYLEEPKSTGTFTKRKPQRYDQPAGSGVRCYFPSATGALWKCLRDTGEPIIITEGEKKALASACAGFATIGLGGVFNYLQEGELLPELQAFKWHGREVYIVFDSDAAMNPMIQAAEARLVDELMRKRGAKCYLVRLPPLDNGDKQGVDDYLVHTGADRFRSLLLATESLGAVDAAVVALNGHVAWIERDSAVYDISARHFLKTDGFTRGSKYSAETAWRVITSGKKPGVKEIRIAAEWLTHPLARRYADLLFRPGEGALVENDMGAPAFNVWHGWGATPGDVKPVFALTDYLFSLLPAEHRDYPLKLMAYKAQNPTEKTFASVLTGDQGGGKTLWCNALAKAFAPYSCSISSQQFLANFQGWMERNLLAIVNEAKPGHLEEASEALKKFITDTDQQMNEKYRTERMVKCYTSFILTANDRGVGAFAHDDRRMFVIPCPPTHPEGRAFYAPVYEWLKTGGGRHLMHWLTTVDLQGWQPGAKPPTTAEKAMARRESLTETERLAEDMRGANGNVIFMWIVAAMNWANAVINGSASPQLKRHAQEIIDSYNSIQVRDWYTPEEIAQMFPQIAAALYGSRRTAKTVAGDMSLQLRNAGVRYLECTDNPEGFKWRGGYHQFLVVANRDDWARPATQIEFDNAMRNWPRFCEMKQQTKIKR